MTTFNDEDIRKLSRLAWALQILMKDVLDQLDTLGNASVLLERLERVERLVAFSKGIMTSDQACELLGIGKSQLYKLVHMYDLPTFKPSGKRMFFKVEDIVTWTTEHPSQRRIRPIEHTGLVSKGEEDYE